MKDIDEEERPTYFKSKSKEEGYLGLSILHRLYPLYGFNFLTDAVFDVMHLLPLNVVKNHIERLIGSGSLNRKVLQENLSKMPWTTDYCASRLPKDIDSVGSWKGKFNGMFKMCVVKMQ
ncbi:uncharacterized protein LOC114574627 [Exaiptasia diaphana]|uniref:Uncharacterized protein n=1 Tax=Exaiptasia diaphana TaxID=2652724 RepID=A0A913YGL5_EXADI|nr:uncharacterized protein LOC114574627 [Exaiptasia diaphana]